MRYLKNKLARAREYSIKIGELQEQVIVKNEENFNSIQESKEINCKVEPLKDQKSEKSFSKSAIRREERAMMPSPNQKAIKGSTSSKNIMKNYGRALANFAGSDLAVPYLTDILNKNTQKIKEFRTFISSKKKQSRCIKRLRSLLLVTEKDSQKEATFKRVFQKISVIFIKFFSVNWIFGGKLCDRISHLKYRFKILRRIQNPEHFTYLKGFN